MRILAHIHDIEQIQVLCDPNVDVIITEPVYSYKHPHLQTKAEFWKVLKSCLKQQLPTYIEINGFIEENQLEGLKPWIKDLMDYPIQGFYFADLSVLMMLNELGYQGEKIFAPETILTNTFEVRTYLESVNRVMISKELTLEEILVICSAFPNKVEIFGAGHLQMSVSKRPLLSNYLSLIQKEHSTLNQINYRLREMKRLEKMPILEETNTFCVFTQGILNPLEELPQIQKAHCFGIHFDPLFMNKEDAKEYFELILNQLKSHEPEKIRAFTHKTSLPLFKGYFYRKTNLSKEKV